MVGVCPLMPSCNTYHLTCVSLTLGVGYLFTAAPAKHSCCSLPWIRGISSPPPFLTFNVGWLHLGPPVPSQPPLLGHGIALPCRHPWPRTWGSSSWPFLHRHSLALSAAVLDLGHGVTPLGHCPSGMGSSWLLPLTSDV